MLQNGVDFGSPTIDIILNFLADTPISLERYLYFYYQESISVYVYNSLQDKRYEIVLMNEWKS